MTALAAIQTGPADAVVASLLRDGYHAFGEALDARAADALLKAVRAARTFGPDLFLSQEAFEADPRFKGVNPEPGRNLTERFEPLLGFVERAPVLTSALALLLGPDYRLLDRKFVCGAPRRWLAPWLLERLGGGAVNNLGAYIKPAYRDITYFHGIDFHQDVIDHPGRAGDFVTLYVYLHPVTAADAPLHVLAGSHRFAATVFPHLLNRKSPGVWTYEDGRGNAADVQETILTGGAGYAALWHACTLHATAPPRGEEERLSLRYVFTRGESGAGAIERVNAGLRGPLALKATRADLDARGRARVKGNHVASAPAGGPEAAGAEWRLPHADALKAFAAPASVSRARLKPDKPASVALRRLRADDGALVLSWRNRPHVAKAMYTDHLITPDEHAAWFRRTLCDASRRAFVIEADGAPAGCAAFTDIAPRHGRAAWAFYLGEPEALGRGIGTYTEYLLLRHGFERLKLRKLTCEVLADNGAVAALHERFGFTREALLRGHVVKNGAPADVIGLGLHAEDWARARPGIEHTLAARGFALPAHAPD